MKKLILFFALCLVVFGAQAQDTVLNKPYYYYCQFVGDMIINGRVRPIKLVWNNEKDDQILVDQQGNEIVFYTMVDVINYMSKRGWELDNIMPWNNSWFYFYFKKQVTNDAEAKEGLYFKSDFKSDIKSENKSHKRKK